MGIFKKKIDVKIKWTQLKSEVILVEKINKRVLFIHIQFYEYNQRIQDKMRELGYIVDCFCEDPKIGKSDKLFTKFKSEYITIKSVKKQKEFIDTLVKTGVQYDYIFVIKGERLTKEFLMELKRLNPKAHFILYMWDNVERVSNFFEKKEMYNDIYSFDTRDVNQYGFNFLPLFFCDEFKNNNIEKKIDVYFSGWEHSNRRKLLENLIPMLIENNISYYFHLFTGRWRVLKSKIKHRNFKKEPKYIKYQTLSFKVNADLTLKSRILIDIQHPTQTGLTMRTIEALAAKTKLITTNNDIVKYDFYNPNNILVIDRVNPIINPSFLETPYQDVPKEIVERYSLEKLAQNNVKLLGEFK